MTEVQKAIWVSDIPKSLNMNVETRFTAIKGSPMAKYAVGTHAIGFIDFSLLTYRREWNKGRETLLEYGWFYSSELPEEVVNHIYENRKSISVFYYPTKFSKKQEASFLHVYLHIYSKLFIIIQLKSDLCKY